MEPTFIEGAGGLPLAVWRFGTPDQTEDRPVLLVAHATGFHSQCYRAMADALAHRFQVVAFDSRGHGHSGTPSLVADDDGRVPTMDWHRLADDVLAVINALQFGRPWAFGHSCGGAALLLAEQARPGTFAAIYAYEPIVASPQAWLELGQRRGDPAIGARRRRPTFASRAEARERFGSRPPLSRFPADVLADYVDGGFAEQPDGTVALRCSPEAEAATYTMAAWTDTWERLDEIACPVTIACGGVDAHISAEVAATLADRLGDGRVEVHADLGHLGPLERPAEIAAALERCL